jgi:hypothetical protein
VFHYWKMIRYLPKHVFPNSGLKDEWHLGRGAEIKDKLGNIVRSTHKQHYWGMFLQQMFVNGWVVKPEIKAFFAPYDYDMSNVDSEEFLERLAKMQTSWQQRDINETSSQGDQHVDSMLNQKLQVPTNIKKDQDDAETSCMKNYSSPEERTQAFALIANFESELTIGDFLITSLRMNEEGQMIPKPDIYEDKTMIPICPSGTKESDFQDRLRIGDRISMLKPERMIIGPVVAYKSVIIQVRHRGDSGAADADYASYHGSADDKRRMEVSETVEHHSQIFATVPSTWGNANQTYMWILISHNRERFINQWLPNHRGVDRILPVKRGPGQSEAACWEEWDQEDRREFLQINFSPNGPIKNILEGFIHGHLKRINLSDGASSTLCNQHQVTWGEHTCESNIDTCNIKQTSINDTVCCDHCRTRISGESQNSQ